VVHGPALSPQQAKGHSATPAEVISSYLPQPIPELSLLQVDDLAAVAFGAAVLAHHPAGQAF
jgi:hypothetical protein